MWKYIVIWFLMIETPCPPRHWTDEFGREIYSNTLEYCVGYDKDEGHSKEFPDRDSALAFYERAKKQLPDVLTVFNIGKSRLDTFLVEYYDGCIVDLKLDSTYIEYFLNIADTLSYIGPWSLFDSPIIPPEDMIVRVYQRGKSWVWRNKVDSIKFIKK